MSGAWYARYSRPMGRKVEVSIPLDAVTVLR
jgi:hypothetical protein